MNYFDRKCKKKGGLQFACIRKHYFIINKIPVSINIASIGALEKFSIITLNHVAKILLTAKINF